MPFCRSCAAPLPAYTSRCEYCGVKNDVDLQGISDFTVVEQHTGRICPLCTVPMETIGLKNIPGFYIEKCASCRGLFFDPEELNLLLDKSVEQVYSIDFKKIWSINQTEQPATDRIRAYIKCPICGVLMNRVNFAVRSGVVIDQCRHGIWLDDGELRKLLEWRKAGGQLLHEQVMTDRAQREAAGDTATGRQRLSGDFIGRSSAFPETSSGASDAMVVLTAVAKLLGRLFV